MKKVYNYIINLIFPKKCINCKKEGSFLCEDCLSLVDINQIQYCSCVNNPIKNIKKCNKCFSRLDAVYTVLNKKQKLAKKLYAKSKNINELNTQLSFLIISHLNNRTSINKNTVLVYENKEIKPLVEKLSKYLKIKISNDFKNKDVLIITKTYPFENLEKRINSVKKREANKISIVSLFRQIDF